MNMEVGIEIVHKAWKNVKPTIEGYTHDWTICVQGVNDYEIKHIVEKVIFHLPNSYPDPLRIKKRPPFILSESTSSGFSMPIEIFFCAGSKLNKVNYVYDVSIGDAVVNNSLARRLTFPNPSKTFKEKLVLAGGKVVDLPKIAEVNAAFVKCKVEPEEEIEIIKEVNNGEVVNSTVQKINEPQNETGREDQNLLRFSDLLKENAELKTTVARVKERTELQQKLINFYEKKMSEWEAGILASNKGIIQLKKNIEAKENQISTLTMQVQMLENQFLQMKNTPAKDPKEKRGRKRKNNENLNESVPVEKKRGNVFEPSKVASSPSRDDSCATNLPAYTEHPVSKKNQNVCETVAAKSGHAVAQSKTDTVLSVTKHQSSKNHPDSQSKGKEKPVSVNSSLCTAVHGESNLKSSNSQTNVSSATFSIKSEIINDEELMETKSLQSNDGLNKSDPRNSCSEKPVSENLMEVDSEIRNEIETPIRRNSGAVDAAVKESEIQIIGCVKREPQSPMKVSLCVPETRNDSIAKPMEGNAVSSNGCMSKSIVGSMKKEPESPMEVSPTSISEPRNDVVKPMEVNPVTANGSVSKSRTKHTNIEKPAKVNGDAKLLRGTSVKADAVLSKSKTRNGDGEKSMEKNSVELDVSQRNIQLGKGDNAEISRIKESEKAPEGSSVEVSVNESEKRKADHENIVDGSPVDVTSPSNNIETRNDDAVEKSSAAYISLSKMCSETADKNLMREPSDASVKNSSKKATAVEKTDLKSFHPKSKEIGKRRSSFGDRFASSTPRTPRFLKKTKNPNAGYLKKFGQMPIWKESHPDTSESSAPNLMEFMNIRYPEVVAELDRIHNSKFNKFRHKTNPLFYKLEGIHGGISEKFFTRYTRSLADFFTDPKASFDMATIVFLVVDYLSCSKINHIDVPTYSHNGEVYTVLPRGENCIVCALYEVEQKSIPRLDGLLRKVLRTIHRTVISKKGMGATGLASLCRVFMELCRLCDDRWQPAFLCCELLKTTHPLAPFLINSLAGVWRDPFYLHNEFSDEERMLLSSIVYGMDMKPVPMPPDLWRLSCRLASTYFPCPIRVDPHDAIDFLTKMIISRCNEGLFEDLWMLTSPLLIFVLNETWEWKMCFRNEYIIPNLLRFSRCLNEQAFNLFCNLFVDVCNFCHESPVEELKRFVSTKVLPGDASLVQDCAAVALLKYVGSTDDPIPVPLRNWFLRNINNPKLAVIGDIYCKRVMESQNSLLLWDDIIIL